jgi:hypothetical protein
MQAVFESGTNGWRSGQEAAIDPSANVFNELQLSAPVG